MSVAVYTVADFPATFARRAVGDTVAEFSTAAGTGSVRNTITQVSTTAGDSVRSDVLDGGRRHSGVVGVRGSRLDGLGLRTDVVVAACFQSVADVGLVDVGELVVIELDLAAIDIF